MDSNTHPLLGRKDVPPDLRVHGELWKVVRGVGRGSVAVDDAVERLRALVSQYLPPGASEGHAAFVGIRLVERSLGAIPGKCDDVAATWHRQAAAPPDEHPAYRAVWYMVGYMGLVVPDSDVVAGERRLYARLMELAPKQIVIQ